MTGPDVRDERLMELRSRGLDVEPRVAWRSNGTFVALLFFALTAVAVGASYGLLAALGVEGSALITGIAAIAFAELLIRRHRFFGTGVESALWLTGVFALIFGLPGEGSEEALLLFAAGSGLAGFRVRNALFGALAVVFVIAYAAVRDAALAAAAAGVAASALALVMLAREWQRPSTERLWIALLTIPPIAAMFATVEETPVWWALVHVALAAFCAMTGLRLRTHAPLIGAAVHAVIAAVNLEVHELLPFAPEWRLIVAGAFLLTASAVVARALRDRTRGVVVTPESLTGIDEEMQILATIATQPRGGPPEEEKGGGRFGGAGATGDY